LLELPPAAALNALDHTETGEDVLFGLSEDHERILTMLLPADPRPSLRIVPPPIATAGAAPAGVTEQKIAALWRRTLRLDWVGRDASFFELGGSSLQLSVLHLELERMLGRPVPLTSLFRFPAISKLANHLLGADAGAPAPASGAKRRSSRRRYGATASRNRDALNGREGAGAGAGEGAAGRLDRRRLQRQPRALSGLYRDGLDRHAAAVVAPVDGGPQGKLSART